MSYFFNKKFYPKSTLTKYLQLGYGNNQSHKVAIFLGFFGNQGSRCDVVPK